MSKLILNHFLTFVEKSEGCWIWTGLVHVSGFGRFRAAGFPELMAHRAMWVLSGNTLKRQERLIQVCKNKLCVRLDHLVPIDKALDSRFWANVNKTGKCWEWTAGKTTAGYGCFRYEMKDIYCHRFSWQIRNGPIPMGLHVLHKCDNPACVNPDHLFLGNDQDNVDDMVRKGRNPRGENHSGSKLTWEIVDKMRLEYDGKWGNKTAVGRKFGVPPSRAIPIISYKSWRSK